VIPRLRQSDRRVAENENDFSFLKPYLIAAGRSMRTFAASISLMMSKHRREIMLSKITKALVAALVLGGGSLGVASNASAAPQPAWQYQGGYMHARHDPTNTNGF
jgi:phage-related minor tail protein